MVLMTLTSKGDFFQPLWRIFKGWIFLQKRKELRRRPKSLGQFTECEMILLCPKASTEHKVDSLEDLFRRKELPEESRAAEKRQNQEDVFVSHSRRQHCLPYYRHNLLL